MTTIAQPLPLWWRPIAGRFLARLANDALTAAYGPPPPPPPPPRSDDDHDSMDDEETRLYVALVCAAHF